MQLYARRHFLFPPLSIEEYNDRVTAVVRCEAQVCYIWNLFQFLIKLEVSLRYEDFFSFQLFVYVIAYASVWLHIDVAGINA